MKTSAARYIMCAFLAFSLFLASCGDKPAVSFTLGVSVQGQGSVHTDPAGTGGSYPAGAVVSLTPAADTGWSFSGWDGDLTGSDSPASITMDSDKEVTAAFLQLTPAHHLTVGTTGTGAGTVAASPASGDGTYAPGTVVTLTPTPGAASAFTGWSGDGSGWAEPYEVTMTGDVSITACFSSLTSVGAPVTTYPSWQERTLLAFLNMGRMAPSQFRTAYVSALGDVSQILQSYSAQPPLAWDYGLDQAARFHSQDMADHNVVQNDSSDGTPWYTRVGTYYTGAVHGECIGAGYASPFAAARAFYYFNGMPDGPTDGYRQLLMAAAVKASAAGYGYNAASDYKSYWTVDLGRTAPAFSTPFIWGSHDFITTGYVTFVLNYYDPSGTAPRKVQLVLSSVKNAVTQVMGDPARGTYVFTTEKSSTTRSYYFTVVDGEGGAWRCPGPGTFWTLGEGSGTDNYTE